MLIPLLCLLICLGGCQLGKDKLPSEMDPKKLPDGRAFKDEFTRQFLQSTEEVMPGYYPFLAKNGKYEMAFPREGITDDTSYRSKTNFESIHFTDWEEGKDSSAMVDVRFYSYYTAGENVEIMQETLESNQNSLSHVSHTSHTSNENSSYRQDSKNSENNQEVDHQQQLEPKIQLKHSPNADVFTNEDIQKVRDSKEQPSPIDNPPTSRSNTR